MSRHALNKLTRAGRYAALLVFLSVSVSSAQSFDFNRLQEKARQFSVIVKATVSMSMGSEPFESKVRGLGLIVRDDGLVMIDASLVDFGSGMSAAYGVTAGFDVFNMTIETLDGDTYDAEWLGADRFSGLGFCRITNVTRKFNPAKFERRNDYRVGEWVALFYLLPENVSPPLGADVGMITAILDEPEKAPLLVGFGESQINSPLFDERGRVIGILNSINSAGSQPDFMDPASFMQALSGGAGAYPLLGIIGPERLNPLIEDPPVRGKKTRGWLGVSYQALTKELIEYWGLDAEGGVIINEVVRNSPAEAAGVKVGDVLVAINGETLSVDREENLGVFGRSIAEIGAGEIAELTVFRREGDTFKKIDLEAELTQAPITSAEAETYEDEDFEFKARNLVFNDYLFNNLDQETFHGVVVTEVSPGGWADLGGLTPGDIVQLVNGTKVSSVVELQEMMAEISGERREEVVFFVWRNNKTLFVNIKPNWKSGS